MVAWGNAFLIGVSQVLVTHISSATLWAGRGRIESWRSDQGHSRCKRACAPVVDCAEESKVCPEVIEGDGRCVVRPTFEGQAPGIPDIQAALKHGFTTGSGSASGLAERDG
jgi:hypothetical protein